MMISVRLLGLLVSFVSFVNGWFYLNADRSYCIDCAMYHLNITYEEAVIRRIEFIAFHNDMVWFSFFFGGLVLFLLGIDLFVRKFLPYFVHYVDERMYV